jgi:hypothetical protein
VKRAAVSQPVARKRILVGAMLSTEEWLELRKLALTRNEALQDMAGLVLRDFLSRETGMDVYR